MTTMHSWPPPPPPGSVTPREAFRGPARTIHSYPPPAPDPLDAMREMIGELELLATVWQAAGICAAALARTVGARAVFVHAYDAPNHEIRTIGADGAGSRDQLGETHSADDDFVASAILTNGKSMTLRLHGELPRCAPQRLHAIGAARSVLALPVMVWGECVAIIEVIDVDEALSRRTREACSVAADALVRFHSARAAAA